jgi:hypothetical protein
VLGGLLPVQRSLVAEVGGDPASRGFWKLSVNALAWNEVAQAFWNAAWSALIRAFAEAGDLSNCSPP